MITYTTGDIFKANTEALVNPVNCVGVMGKGLALEFKRRFQKNFQEYKFQCDNDLLEIGEMLITGPYIYTNYPTYIINFQTIEEFEIKSIAIPALGVGNGGLDWKFVKPMMDYRLKDSTAEIIIYNPL